MRRAPHVLVLGGGVAGLSAAHELAERGLRVTVVEKRQTLGGKARSIGVPRSGTGGRRDLPGEHGFRFFPRFYRHVTDTMSRIPFGANPRGVLDNLVDTSQMGVAEPGAPLFVNTARFPTGPGDLEVMARAARSWRFSISPRETASLGRAVWRVATTCRERRRAELDGVTWGELSGLAQGSDTYQSLMGLTQIFVALRADRISACTTGTVAQQMLRDLLTPGGSSDRVLCGPTSEAWIDPWREYLLRLGVDLLEGLQVRRLCVEDGHIGGVEVSGAGGTRVLTADHVVCALPLDVAASLITPELVALDPGLSRIPRLAREALGWMVGVQLFLRRPLAFPHGHVIHMDTPWALTSVTHERFWGRGAASRYGSSDVRCVLSVDISDWDTPGLCGKAARDCTEDELRQEVLAQLSSGLAALDGLQQSDIVGWMLDPAITPARGGRRASNDDPLFVNSAASWAMRPGAETAIANLCLAGDYVATDTELASMEGANEAARRAVNVILRRTRSDRDRCALWGLQEPRLTAPLRAIDQVAFDRGRRWPWGRALVEQG